MKLVIVGGLAGGDDRKPEECSQGHVPGAVKIPVDEFRDRLGVPPVPGSCAPARSASGAPSRRGN